MEKDFFAGYDEERARFRTFLRICLDRFASNEHKAAARIKRGGGERALSLDFDGAEGELVAAGDPHSPEDVFDREWRRSLFDLAIEALRARSAGDKATAFAAFERYDLCPGVRPTYEEIARELGVTTTTITNHLAWARRELRRLVLERLEEITGSDDEYGAEARALLGPH
jgi:DNA-directed RNA polymerase specialized sigma24 family protein